MLRQLILALSSAVLLILSFPNFNQPWCAWVALVPWMLVLQDLKVPGTSQSEKSARHFFGWSYLVGLGFFLGSIWWLIHVTLVGWVALCLYLALYFGVFGWLVHRIYTSAQESEDRRQKTEVRKQKSERFPLSSVPSILLIPSAWVTLEYLRSHALSGFGWNLLGYSQTPALSAIQLADLTGVWGVSFVIVMVNVAMAHYLTVREVRKAIPVVLVAMGVVLATWFYGRFRLTQPDPEADAKIAIVQGNIPQEEKWDTAYREAILAKYERLTREAARDMPQLIIWPETAVPGYLGFDEPLTARVQQVAQSVKVPLVVGAPMGTLNGQTWQLTNSAALLDASGAIVSRYDKLHLVPFGEFVPFESVVPWLRKILPPIGDFVPGREYTVFELNGSRLKAQGSRQELLPPASSLQPPAFSVLICFEDIFPELARQFVRRGARMLVTITNDAWFRNTAAAYQHAQASTFRAVELRVPMVRAANTGWSGCIDANGRWLTSVHDRDGKELFIEGIASCELAPGESGTLYRRWGDWFAWLCLLVTIGWLAGHRLKVRSAR